MFFFSKQFRPKLQHNLFPGSNINLIVVLSKWSSGPKGVTHLDVRILLL